MNLSNDIEPGRVVAIGGYGDVYDAKLFDKKTNQWTRVAAKKFRLMVEKEKEFPFFWMDHGNVVGADVARILHEQDVAAGLQPTPFVEEDQCIFFKYYTMRKKMWGSPKVVAVP